MVDCTSTFLQIQFLCLAVKMFPLKSSVPPMVMPGLKRMESFILPVRLEHLFWWRWKKLQVRRFSSHLGTVSNIISFLSQCPLDESNGFYSENGEWQSLVTLNTFPADWEYISQVSLMVAFLFIFPVGEYCTESQKLYIKLYVHCLC